LADFMPPETFTILLIEDDPSDALLIREMLRESKSASFHLEVVDRLSHGVRRAIEQKWDALLLDLTLPDSGGLATFLRAHESAPAIPILVLSGLHDEKLALQAVQAGAQDYLIKDEIDSPLLVRSIRYAVERGRAERERTTLLAREREARAAAEAANNIKDQFLATLSHELRTPINAIVGWSRLLKAGKLDPGGVARALDVIDRNAQIQVQLIDDLLDVGRIVAGSLRLCLEPVDLRSVVAAAIDSIRPVSDVKKVRIAAAVNGEPSILGDRNRLQQVVWNLLSNAIKFTPSGGEIEIRVEPSDTDAVLWVRDNGIGISPDFLPFVFEPFRQADSSTARSHTGLGLGLAIVRHLVELHGGTASAESDGPGRGATFKVRLPLASAPKRSAAASDKPAQERQR
jgi:signal transduction histidine kinase